MRILMVSPQFCPIIGGYEKAAERLAFELVNRGHNVTVVTERRSENWLREEEFSGVQVRRLWCLHKAKLHVGSSVLSFMRYLLLHGSKYDVWHIHQYGWIAGCTILVAKLLNKPTVLKITNSRDHGIAETLGTVKFFNKLIVWAHLKVDLVAAISCETAEEARAFGFKLPKIVVIPNGVDTKVFRPIPDLERMEIRLRLGITEKYVAIAVGRLSAAKNLSGLIDAWGSAFSSGCLSEWELLIVGDGPLKGALAKKLQEFRHEARIRLVGAQHGVEKWLAASDLYVSASNFEGMSNTLLEAMASGLPILATRVSAVPELVADTGAGLVVDVADLERLADGFKVMADSANSRVTMGKLARACIIEGYSIEAVAEEYEKIYRRLAGGNGKN